MFSAPDSSLSILRAIESSHAHFNEETKAKFALLMSQARSRNRIAPSNDSLISVALKYYSTHSDKRSLAWTYLYASDIHDHLGNDSLAIDFIIKAHDQAADVDDDRLKMMIHYFWGNMIEYAPPFDEAIKHLCEAKKYAELCGDTLRSIVCLNEIGSSLIYMDNPGEAKEAYQEALKIARGKNADRYLKPLYTGMSMACFMQDSISDALVYINKALASTENVVYGDSLQTKLLKNAILVKIGLWDEAESELSGLLENISSSDAGAVWLDLSTIADERGDHHKALYYYKKYAECLDSAYKNILDNRVLDWQNKYELLKSEGAYDRLQLKYRNIVIAVAMLIIIILSLMLLFKIKSSRSRLELHKVAEANKQMKEDFKREQAKTNDLLNDKKNNLDMIRTQLISNDLTMAKIMALKDMDNNARKKQMNEMVLSEEEKIQLIKITNMTYANFPSKLAGEHPNLTTDDIVLCCLLKFEIKSADIAVLLNVPSNTLKQRKQRLKRKLEIINSVDEWLQSKH